jgi:hypothetical protein
MKKSIKYSIITFVITALLLSACGMKLDLPGVVRGSGNVITEERSVSGFEYIKFNGAGEIFIEQGTEEKLVIEAEDNILPKITNKVENGVLTLGLDTRITDDQVIPTKNMVYRLTFITLSGLNINGAATLNVKQLFAGDFEFNVNGTGNATFEDFQADKLTVEIDGGANVTFKGLVPQQSVVINGAGGYDAGDLETGTTSITFNGAGKSTVWALDDLTISINGAGSVEYYGDPHVTQSITGLGNVKPLGNK